MPLICPAAYLALHTVSSSGGAFYLSLCYRCLERSQANSQLISEAAAFQSIAAKAR